MFRVVSKSCKALRVVIMGMSVGRGSWAYQPAVANGPTHHAPSVALSADFKREDLG